MGGEDDRKYLSGLNELEREKILDERYKKREEEKKKSELLKMDKNKKNLKEVQLGAIHDLKQRRDKRNEALRRRDIDSPEMANYSSYGGKRSPRDYDNDPDYDYENARSRSRKRIKISSGKTSRNKSIGKLKEIEIDREVEAEKDWKRVNKICLSRDFLVKMANHLHFSQTVKGCLVKVNLTKNNKVIYKAGEIVDVVERSEEYLIDEKNGKKINKYLIIRIDNEEKEFPFKFCSNKDLDDHEVYKWLTELEKSGKKRPTIFQIEEKYNKYKSLLNSKYTSQDIQKMVEKKRKYIFERKFRFKN